MGIGSYFRSFPFFFFLTLLSSRFLLSNGCLLKSFLVSRTFFMPTGTYVVSVRPPYQQLFFTRLDEKIMIALATGLIFSVD